MTGEDGRSSGIRPDKPKFHREPNAFCTAHKVGLLSRRRFQGRFPDLRDRGIRCYHLRVGECPLWVKSRHPATYPFTSAFGGKADSLAHPSACLLIAKRRRRNAVISQPSAPLGPQDLLAQ